MGRLNPLLKKQLLYLGEIAEPPRWLPSGAQSAIAPILHGSSMGVFFIENPSPENIRRLESVARESSGVVAVFRAGEMDVCLCIGPRGELAGESTGSGEEAPLRREDFYARDDGYSFKSWFK